MLLGFIDLPKKKIFLLILKPVTLQCHRERPIILFLDKCTIQAVVSEIRHTNKLININVDG